MYSISKDYIENRYVRIKSLNLPSPQLVMAYPFPSHPFTKYPPPLWYKKGERIFLMQGGKGRLGMRTISTKSLFYSISQSYTHVQSQNFLYSHRFQKINYEFWDIIFNTDNLNNNAQLYLHSKLKTIFIQKLYNQKYTIINIIENDF